MNDCIILEFKNKVLYFKSLEDIKAATTEQKRTFLPEAKARVQEKLKKATATRNEAKNILIGKKSALEAIKQPPVAPSSNP